MPGSRPRRPCWAGHEGCHVLHFELMHKKGRNALNTLAECSPQLTKTELHVSPCFPKFSAENLEHRCTVVRVQTKTRVFPSLICVRFYIQIGRVLGEGGVKTKTCADESNRAAPRRCRARRPRGGVPAHPDGLRRLHRRQACGDTATAHHLRAGCTARDGE